VRGRAAGLWPGWFFELGQREWGTRLEPGWAGGASWAKVKERWAAGMEKKEKNFLI